MKKPIFFMACLTIIAGLSFTSCVSNKKFMASEAKADKYQKENASKENQLIECNAQVKNCNDQKAALLNENASAQNDLKALTTESKMTIADQAKRLKNLQGIIQSQRDVMNKLKNSIAEALLNYKADELSVYIKDGNVYVSLEEKLLFKSGSDVVNPQGKEALKTLANVLKGTKDVAVLIEGHTDNVPIKTNMFKDNWDLSTARAVSIVRLLTKTYGFNSDLITASGRGQFHPVKSNETAEGRAGNRRTEVILSPDLSELYKLLYQ
jgi:chemotaxis protein MotB